jgi:KDO2-lipid IV(A) lauroyltransferase
MGPNACADKVNEAARRAYRVLLQNYYDLFHFPAQSAEQVRAAILVDGWETVEEAQRQGKGVILCSAHIGQVEAGLQVAALNGLPVWAPAEHIRPERLYNYLTNLRTRHGLRFIPADGPMLSVFRALKRGEVVGIVLDRDTTNSGVVVPLCGELAHVPDGYARLAAKTCAPLVTGFCYRLPGGRVRTELRQVYVPDSQGADRQMLYEAALGSGVRALERAITAHPDQWVLTTPIWVSDHLQAKT